MSSGLIRPHQNSFAVLYRLLDTVIIAVLMLLACYALDHAYTKISIFQTVSAVALFLLFAESLELYRSWRTDTFVQLMAITLACWGLVCGTLISLIHFTTIFNDGSKIVSLLWLTACTVVLPLWRYILRLGLNHARRNGANTRTALIIGVTPSGVSLAKNIKQNPQLGINLLGFCDDRETRRLNKDVAGFSPQEHIGGINHAVGLAKTDTIDNIFIALPMCAEKRIQEILRICGNTTATVHIIPDFFTFNLINSRLSKVGNMQTLSVYDTPINGLTNWVKRLEDLIIASVALTVFAVPMLVIAAIIKLTSRGPVFFKQDRYGLDGKSIKVWKFRSMTSCDNNGVIKQVTKNDARITPFGAFLRKTSLDELPQFINVLQGSMSVVGPRPHAVAHNEQYRELIGCYMVRHKVKPGITGWAQINGWRGETETLYKMEKRVEHDLDYLRKWSVTFDLKIVFLTLFKGFIGKNVY